MILFARSYLALIFALVVLARALHEGVVLTPRAILIRLICGGLFLALMYFAVGGFINWWRRRKDRTRENFGWWPLWRRG